MGVCRWISELLARWVYFLVSFKYGNRENINLMYYIVHAFCGFSPKLFYQILQIFHQELISCHISAPYHQISQPKEIHCLLSQAPFNKYMHLYIPLITSNLYQCFLSLVISRTAHSTFQLTASTLNLEVWAEQFTLKGSPELDAAKNMGSDVACVGFLYKTGN